MKDATRPMTPSITDGIRTARPPHHRGSKPASWLQSEGMRPLDSHAISDRGASDDVGPGQTSALEQQRFAIITVYSFAILLALGYVPGFSL